MAELEDYGERNRSHISISAFRQTAAYAFPSRKQERKPLRDDYATHAAALLDQLAVALGAPPTPEADTRLSVEGLKLGTMVCHPLIVSVAERSISPVNRELIWTARTVSTASKRSTSGRR